jgi:hypothetical protein
VRARGAAVAPNADMSLTWDRESNEPARSRLGAVLVGRQLKLRSGLLRGFRAALIPAMAAVLAWAYPVSVTSPEGRIGIFAGALLYVWLVARLAAVALGISKPRPRCPRCAHKVVLAQGISSCPTCHVSFGEKVRREWRNTAPAQSPWITRPDSLRTGQLTRR